MGDAKGEDNEKAEESVKIIEGKKKNNPQQAKGQQEKVKSKLLVIIIGCFSVLLGGCGRGDSAMGKAKTVRPGVVEYMTGAYQLEKYKELKSKLKGIGEARKSQILEIE